MAVCGRRVAAGPEAGGSDACRPARLHDGRRRADSGVSFGSDVVSGARVCRGFGVGLAVAFGVGLAVAFGVGLAVAFGVGLGVGFGFGVGLGVGLGVGGTLILMVVGALPAKDHPWIPRGEAGGELVRPRPRRADLALARIGDRGDACGRRRLTG